MKIYLERTNGYNVIALTDGNTAKIFDVAPNGIYEGIDLYSDDAIIKLKELFSDLNNTGCLEDYDFIYSDNEIEFEDVKSELEEFFVLIYDTLGDSIK